jgi:hypothetical protein
MEQVGLISHSVVSLTIHPREPFKDIWTDPGIDFEDASDEQMKLSQFYAKFSIS